MPNPVFINIDGSSEATLTVSDLESIVDKVFYGARQDILTGKTYIDIIGSDSAITLGDTFSSKSTDYLNWMWSNNTLRFSVTNTGHILMEVY